MLHMRLVVDHFNRLFSSSHCSLSARGQVLLHMYEDEREGHGWSSKDFYIIFLLGKVSDRFLQQNATSVLSPSGLSTSTEQAHWDQRRCLARFTKGSSAQRAWRPHQACEFCGGDLFHDNNTPWSMNNGSSGLEFTMIPGSFHFIHNLQARLKGDCNLATPPLGW